MEKVLLTPEEAARLLSVGRTSLFEAIRSGELESIKVGRLRRIPMSSLQAYVDRLGYPPVEAPTQHSEEASVLRVVQEGGAPDGELSVGTPTEAPYFPTPLFGPAATDVPLHSGVVARRAYQEVDDALSCLEAWKRVEHHFEGLNDEQLDALTAGFAIGYREGKKA